MRTITHRTAINRSDLHTIGARSMRSLSGSTPSRPLRLNFYEQPAELRSLFWQAFSNRTSRAPITSAVSRTLGCHLWRRSRALPPDERVRPIRKVQMYWAILKKAGFPADEARLKALGLTSKNTKHFDPFSCTGDRGRAVRVQRIDVGLVAGTGIGRQFRRGDQQTLASHPVAAAGSLRPG